MVTAAALLNALYFIVGAQQRLFGNDESAAITAPDCRVTSQNLTCVPLPIRSREAPGETHLDAPSIDDASEHVRPECTTSLRSGPRSVPKMPDEYEQEDGSIYLTTGTLVELYGDKSAFAVPAYVMGHSRERDSSSVKYRLANIITNGEYDVDPKFIHPYQAYDDGTKAHCNVGSLRKLYMVPCTVKSHSANGNGMTSYEVSYVDRLSNKQAQATLPLSRVQRVRLAHRRKAVA